MRHYLRFSQRPCRRFGFIAMVACTIFGPELAIAESNQEIKIITMLPHTRPVRSIAVAPELDIAVTGSDDESVKIWSLSSGRLVRTIGKPLNAVGAISLSTDGKMLITGGYGDARIWEVASGRLLHELGPQPSYVTQVAFSMDGSRAFTVASKHSSCGILEQVND